MWTRAPAWRLVRQADSVPEIRAWVSRYLSSKWGKSALTMRPWNAQPPDAGDEYSIADIIVLPFFGMVIDGLGLPERDFPQLHAWYERCKRRPNVQKQPWFDAFAGEKANVDQHVLA